MQSAYHPTAKDILVTRWAGGLEETVGLKFVDGIYERIDEGLTRMIIDFSDVDYISSMEIGLLVRLHARIKMKQGEVKLCSIHGIVPEVLRVTHMDKVFDVQPDLDSAVAAFEGP